jgi:hypothetical protein
MQLVQKIEDERDPNKEQCSTRANTISPSISQQSKIRKQGNNSRHIIPTTFLSHHQQARQHPSKLPPSFRSS